MLQFIWVFTVCQITSLAVSSIQRVKPVLFYISHSDAYPTDLIMNDFECVLGQYFRLNLDYWN